MKYNCVPGCILLDSHVGTTYIVIQAIIIQGVVSLLYVFVCVRARVCVCVRFRETPLCRGYSYLVTNCSTQAFPFTEK